MAKSLIPSNVSFTNKTYGKGEVIIVEGDTNPDSLYYILSGSVDIHRNCGEADRVLLATLNSGDFFGELSLFLKEPRTATVTAREHARIMEVQKCNIHDFINDNPAVTYNMMETLCARFSKMLKQQDLMMNILQSLVSTESVGGRVRSTLKVVAQSISFHKILIATVDKNTGMINVRHSYLENNINKSFLHPSMPFKPGEFLHDVLEESKPNPFVCSNLSETPYAANFAKLGGQAVILVPVILADEIWGCMAAYDCFNVRNFSDNDIQFLQLLTSALAKLVMEDDLRKEEKMRILAEEENRAKSRFLAHMSHEIRTPMNAVLGITEMELRKSHPPETKEALMRIHKSSSLQLSIINDILDIAKVESGKMEVIPAAYDMSSLIMDSVQLNLIHRHSNDVEFCLHVDERLPASLIGDELRIKQIINNLMSNAFKYTQEGVVTMWFRADYTAVHELILVIEIEDTGRGMTQEQVNRIFNEDFIRFDKEANHKIEGAGLGMSIVYHMVNIMGGNAELKSFPGKGSLFSVWIPQKANSKNTLGKETVKNLEKLNFEQWEVNPATQMSFTPMPYGRVLVVDDVETNLYVAQEILKAYEINVDIVESGAEAISQIEGGSVYDIIFMDHMMPDMDGIETTKRIRDTGYPHPIVALTANAVEGMAELFERNGFSGFISKPIDLNQLDGYLLKFIQNKHHVYG